MRTVETYVNGIKVVDVIMENSDLSSAELKQQRLDTCNTCEFIVNAESCSRCSCLLVNRVAYVESFCPEGKW
jgi:hypothetical protein